MLVLKLLPRFQYVHSHRNLLHQYLDTFFQYHIGMIHESLIAFTT